MITPLPRIDSLPEAPGPSGPVFRESRTSAFFRELALAVARDATASSAGLASLPDAASATIGSLAAPSGAAPSPGTASLGAAPPSSGLQQLLVAAARQEGVPPALLQAVVDQESGFDPRAVSPVGAKGLTQLMDGTARGLGVTNPFDPWQSLVGGARFLHSLLDRYGGDTRLAVAAYNAGPGAVDAYNGVPPYAETQTYVRRVLGLYAQYGGQNGTG